ncbi:MAG: hypothetical protein JXB30_07960, partial [Anaerolineae bacterium]|nr:hypothetical protein [Anaerolineae bacterium]
AAVHAGAAAAGDIPLAHDGNHDDTQPAPPDIEVLDDLVTHADEALDASDLSSELEETGGGEGEESKTQGNSLRDEKTIPDDAQKGKNSARAALLGRKKRSSAADDL